MNSISAITQDTGEEAWLFADLFASLLMTIVLLVNAHTSISLQASANQGAEPPPTRLVYMIDANTVRLDSFDTADMSIDMLIVTLKKEQMRAEVVGTATNNGVELFQLFESLQAQKLDFSYAIQP